MQGSIPHSQLGVGWVRAGALGGLGLLGVKGFVFCLFFGLCSSPSTVGGAQRCVWERGIVQAW